MENCGSLASLPTYSFPPGASMNHVDRSTNKSSCRQTCVCNVLIQLVFAKQSECENAVAVQRGEECSLFNCKKLICKNGSKERNRAFTFWQYDMLCTNRCFLSAFGGSALQCSLWFGALVPLNPLLTHSFPKHLGLGGQFLQGWHEDKDSHMSATHAVPIAVHCCTLPGDTRQTDPAIQVTFQQLWPDFGATLGRGWKIFLPSPVATRIN